MAFKDETLLTASAVKLYGRIIDGLTIVPDKLRMDLGANKFLRDQLTAKGGTPEEPILPGFARIYGFSYFGSYTPLTRPVIFLVHGPGAEASPPVIRVTKRIPDAVKDFLVVESGGSVAPAPSPTEQSGVAAKAWEFSSNIEAGEYDRGGFSLLPNLDSGPLERILIDMESGGDDRMPYFGNRAVRRRGPGE